MDVLTGDMSRFMPFSGQDSEIANSISISVEINDLRGVNRMTKADLVEEVAKVTELTRKDSEVIVDTLFESVIKALRPATSLKFEDSAVSESDSATRVSAGIRKPERKSKCRQSAFLISNRARNSKT